MIPKAKEFAVPHVHGVVAHVGQLEAHIGHRDLELRQRHELAVDKTDSAAAISTGLSHLIPPIELI
jgi:hypothetical protein